MSWLPWRLVQIGAAFVSALVLPAVALVVVTGLVRTGAAGIVAFVAWLATMALLLRAFLRR
jgi:hypothetical protein